MRQHSDPYRHPIDIPNQYLLPYTLLEFIITSYCCKILHRDSKENNKFVFDQTPEYNYVRCVLLEEIFGDANATAQHPPLFLRDPILPVVKDQSLH
jgi:hypothetical protein